MSWAGSGFDGRAHVPGGGILKSPVTSCMSDRSSTCSDAERGSPSVAWRAFNSQKRTRKSELVDHGAFSILGRTSLWQRRLAEVQWPCHGPG